MKTAETPWMRGVFFPGFSWKRCFDEQVWLRVAPGEQFLNLWHSFVCHFCTQFKETVWYKRHLEWFDLQLHLCFWVFNSGSQPFTRRAGPPVCLGIAPRTTTFTGQNNKPILLLEVWVCGDLGNFSPQFGNLKDRNPVQNCPDQKSSYRQRYEFRPSKSSIPWSLIQQCKCPYSMLGKCDSQVQCCAREPSV